MNRSKNIIGGILALSVTWGLLLLIGYLLFKEIPEKNIDLFKTGIIAIIGFVNLAVGFYLGSSYGSLVKTDQQVDSKITP